MRRANLGSGRSEVDLPNVAQYYAEAYSKRLCGNTCYLSFLNYRAETRNTDADTPRLDFGE